MGTSADPGTLPAEGSITTFSVIDAVGSIETTDGRTFRFGASGCKTFSPAVGLRVRIVEVAPHFAGGFKAIRLELPEDAEPEYRELIRKRDQAAGINTESSPEQLVATAETLGWITILVDDPKAALARCGVSVWRGERDVTIKVGSLDIIGQVALMPFPKEQIDTSALPPDFDFGDAFITLWFGLPNMRRLMREAAIDRSDPWDRDGIARNVSRAAATLLELGRGAIIHRAGNRGYTREQFLGLLGDPNDVSKRPFRPWVVLGIDRERTRVETAGMSVFGLPEVHARISRPDSEWHFDRAIEAALVATHHMIFQNRIFAAGELLDVECGVSVGADPLRAASSEAEVDRWRVESSTDLLRIERTPDALEPEAQWARSAEPQAKPISVEAYASIFVPALGALLHGKAIARWTPQSARVDHDVQVYQLKSGGFLVATSGLARVVQPGSTVEFNNQRIELVAFVGAHGPPICALLSAIGSYMHAHEDDEARAFKHSDKLAFDNDLGVTRFVLAFRTVLSLGTGPSVTLVELIPVEEAEYKQLNSAGRHALISELLRSAEVAAAHAGLWQRALVQVPS